MAGNSTDDPGGAHGVKQRYTQLVDSSHSESPELLAEAEGMLVRNYGVFINAVKLTLLIHRMMNFRS